MGAAYAAADLVISRAGASSISELALLGKPAILVPSPNVAEDHQTHNALALVDKEAALYVKDSEAFDELIPLALNTIADDALLSKLAHNVQQLAHPDAAARIARRSDPPGRRRAARKIKIIPLAIHCNAIYLRFLPRCRRHRHERSRTLLQTDRLLRGRL